jgi:hypothetical protein
MNDPAPRCPDCDAPLPVYVCQGCGGRFVPGRAGAAPTPEVELAELEASAAAVAYVAYGHATGGKTVRGEPMPAWGDLPEPIRGAWRAAALAIRLAFLGAGGPFAGQVPGETYGRGPAQTALERLGPDPDLAAAARDVVTRLLDRERVSAAVLPLDPSPLEPDGTRVLAAGERTAVRALLDVDLVAGAAHAEGCHMGRTGDEPCTCHLAQAASGPVLTPAAVVGAAPLERAAFVEAMRMVERLTEATLLLPLERLLASLDAATWNAATMAPEAILTHRDDLDRTRRAVVGLLAWQQALKAIWPEVVAQAEQDRRPLIVHPRGGRA